MYDTKNAVKLKAALGISGIQSNVYSWRSPKTSDDMGKGAQIDMVIDRADNCINVCEIKFVMDKFGITKGCDEELSNKRYEFVQTIGKKKTLRLTLLSAYGLQQNSHSGIIQNEIVLADLLK